MCGIVGYIGWKEAAPLVIEGLKRLEYRGYDSYGVVNRERGYRHSLKRPENSQRPRPTLAFSLAGRDPDYPVVD
mgnify:CR=1 FL=1